MAYITKARQEVNATLANAISSRFSNKAREEEMRRTRDEWEKAPTNPKNRKKLRNAGQNDPYLPGDTQLELDISEKGLGNLKIAGKPTIGQYNYNPSESLLVRNYAFENPEGSMTIEQGSEGWIPQQLGTVADYEIADAPRRIKGSAPANVIWKAPDLDSPVIDNWMKRGFTPGMDIPKPKGPQLFPLAQRPSLLFEALRRKREIA